MTAILNKRRTIILSVIGIILILPLVAMQFSNEVNWSGVDFLVACFLLSLIGLVIELIFQFTKNRNQRLILLAVILIFGFLIWTELAVGIFGTAIAGS